MPEVVETRPDPPGRGYPRHGLPQELMEGMSHRPIAQWPACIRQEESRGLWTSMTAVAGRYVVTERPESAGVQGHQPGLVELGVPNRQDAGIQIGVAILEHEGFADP